MAHSDYDVVLSAVEKGDDRAKTELAWYKLCGVGGARKDVDEAVILLEEGVKGGDGEAMWILGLCKEYGMGTEQDIEGSEKLYKQSSEAGKEIGKILALKSLRGNLSGEMEINGMWKEENDILYIMNNDFNRWRVKANEEGSCDCSMDWTESGKWWKDKKWKRENGMKGNDE